MLRKKGFGELFMVIDSFHLSSPHLLLWLSKSFWWNPFTFQDAWYLNLLFWRLWISQYSFPLLETIWMIFNLCTHFEAILRAWYIVGFQGFFFFGLVKWIQYINHSYMISYININHAYFPLICNISSCEAVNRLKTNKEDRYTIVIHSSLLNIFIEIRLCSRLWDYYNEQKESFSSYTVEQMCSWYRCIIRFRWVLWRKIETEIL